ncbi:hypothetical protein SAMN05216236_11236 [Sedimentitalea nanhaiensis]|uniref:Uncharacterized protein n=2 Tax=Sedimentitalea nanhaiensis TaxID=999627 RepID=A0A1I7BUD4_9RHOB|nr:hypothetical protein SAMN05216236_11236 [Sedimentitalea nanhaiensis]
MAARLEGKDVMDDELGHVNYDSERSNFLGTTDQGAWRNRRYSDATAERINHAVKEVIDAIFGRTLPGPARVHAETVGSGIYPSHPDLRCQKTYSNRNRF